MGSALCRSFLAECFIATSYLYFNEFLLGAFILVNMLMQSYLLGIWCLICKRNVITPVTSLIFYIFLLFNHTFVVSV